MNSALPLARSENAGEAAQPVSSASSKPATAPQAAGLYSATHWVALRRFAFAITFLNVLGHSVLGFEQSLAQPLASLAAAYLAELLLELYNARSQGRAPRFAAGPLALFHFLLSAHITGLAVAMLIYANDRIAPVVFASTAAIASKAIFRARVGKGTRHFLNPSNLGISLTLILFPWVGIAPPYMFTENLHGWTNWLLPAIIITSGSFLNAKLTRRMPLILTWLGVFIAQAVLRSLWLGTPIAAALNPVTGVAFLLFTFYMVTDPATTPSSRRGQVAFGAAVAAAYCVLMLVHVVFGLFFALSAVCLLRGMGLWLAEWVHNLRLQRAAVPATAALWRQ